MNGVIESAGTGLSCQGPQAILLSAGFTGGHQFYRFSLFWIVGPITAKLPELLAQLNKTHVAVAQFGVNVDIFCATLSRFPSPLSGTSDSLPTCIGRVD